MSRSLSQSLAYLARSVRVRYICSCEILIFASLVSSSRVRNALSFELWTFKGNDLWQRQKELGHFRNLTVCNVHVPGLLAPNTLGVWLESHDPDHRIEDVKFNPKFHG